MFNQLFQAARKAITGKTPEDVRQRQRIETQITLIEGLLENVKSLHVDVDALRINQGDFFAGTGSCEFGHENVGVSIQWPNLAIHADTIGELLSSIKAEDALSVWFVVYGSNNEVFRCEAEDRQHAIEQCQDAYPGQPTMAAVPANEHGSLVLEYYQEDPVSCPKCAARTEFAELSAGWQAHGCMRCGHTFLAVPEEEEISA